MTDVKKTPGTSGVPQGKGKFESFKEKNPAGMGAISRRIGKMAC